MKRWLAVILLLLAIGVVASTFLFDRAPQSPPPVARNVILISIDTLRADHLSCYGYRFPTSPRIDAFAGRGARFERAISSSGWTVPAHMTMLTGYDALEHKTDGYPEPPKAPSPFDTVAQILKSKGVRTAAFVGGGFLWRKVAFSRGFQKYSSKGRHFTHNVDNARAWVRDHRDERFFLFLHGYDVHRPYTPSNKNARLFSGNYKGRFKVVNLAPDKPRPSDDDLRFAISQYDGEIRDVDDLLGELLSEWEATGLLENTLVIITADHGDEFYEHGQVYHAHSLYDELLHVPLIIVGPGVVPGVHARQVGLIDVTPTILSAMGFVSESNRMQGIDLMPIARGERELPQRLLFSSLRFSTFPYSIAALRDDNWKLIAWDVAGMRGRKMPTKKEYTHKFRLDRDENFDELFDLRGDPTELRDAGADNPDKRQYLAAILQQRLSTARQDLPPKPEKELKLSPKEIEDLEALGYL
jgi:arylsulfatase A-like enzyme